MKNLSQLSQADLLNQAKFLAEEDKRISLLLVEVLAECERRMLHLELGYSSLWDFAVKYLQLSESSAHLRISAMRLSKNHPQVMESLKSGELSLSNAAQLQTFFREKKKKKETLTPETKNKIIQSVSGLSKRECERTLLALSPQSLPVEKERAVSETLTELKLILNESVIEKLKRLKNLLSHQMPEASYGELLEYMTDETLARLERKKGGVQVASPAAPQAEVENEQSPKKVEKTPCPEKVSRSVHSTANFTPALIPTPRKYISVTTRRQVWKQAEGRCEYVSTKGTRCSSRYQLEIEHSIPLALGGRHDQPLKLLCKSHNIQQAVLLLGDQLMKKYIPSLR